MFLTLLTFISAIAISLIAAGYSILGLATLFAGAAVPIIAMGSALEVGKLVAASWLYHNWRSDIPKSLKAYLFTAIIVLIFITNKKSHSKSIIFFKQKFAIFYKFQNRFFIIFFS